MSVAAHQAYQSPSDRYQVHCVWRVSAGPHPQHCIQQASASDCINKYFWVSIYEYVRLGENALEASEDCLPHEMNLTEVYLCDAGTSYLQHECGTASEGREYMSGRTVCSERSRALPRFQPAAF